MKELKNKNCFITGAASGIGRSFAIALAKEGMNLFITDINMEDLEKVKNEIEKIGVKVYVGKCDVSKFKDFENRAKEFYSKLGDVDLLINNAGISIAGAVSNLELEDWKRVLDINLWSVIYSLKVFLPRMIERGSGHIANVSSINGIIGSTDPITYITSKFAVVGLSESLYGQLIINGINVSVILPSYIRTNIYDKSEVRFPKKLLESVGELKLEEYRKIAVHEFEGRASSPDRVVKKYIKGIKENQLYIFDSSWALPIMTLKGTSPQKYQDLIKRLHVDGFNNMKKNFLKIGVNIEDYM
ncbi:MAG: SDR family NAD(P)-dependent oxidoreductase [Candidatus Hodarchaeota archaeon]